MTTYNSKNPKNNLNLEEQTEQNPKEQNILSTKKNVVFKGKNAGKSSKMHNFETTSVLKWSKFISLSLGELIAEFPQVPLKSENIKKNEFLSDLLSHEAIAQHKIVVEGLLDMMQEGYGFIKFKEFFYLSSGEDVYVSHQLIRQYQLRTGDKITGTIKPPRPNDKYFGLESIEFINDIEAKNVKNRAKFEALTPIYPNKRIILKSDKPKDALVLRMIDLLAPIGFGQRCLVVAPPKTGKTEMLQAIAHAITDNHPEVLLFVLLVDERPEEVTEMTRSVKGEVISSTFDEQALRHVQVAEMLLERAKRLVEEGKDVVILLDAITRLARAYNTTCPSSGKVLSGGVEANALHKPKRFFGAARNIENGGSLTIIATALIETNSKMDEVIFEEFKGTGNSEIQLHRALAERGSFPAININSTGTRKDELLLHEQERAKITMLRKILHSMTIIEANELLTVKLKTSRDNMEFLNTMSGR